MMGRGNSDAFLPFISHLLCRVVYVCVCVCLLASRWREKEEEMLPSLRHRERLRNKALKCVLCPSQKWPIVRTVREEDERLSARKKLRDAEKCFLSLPACLPHSDIPFRRKFISLLVAFVPFLITRRTVSQSFPLSLSLFPGLRALLLWRGIGAYRKRFIKIQLIISEASNSCPPL
jgi:hypothetical protein